MSKDHEVLRRSILRNIEAFRIALSLSRSPVVTTPEWLVGCAAVEPLCLSISLSLDVLGGMAGEW